MPNIKSLPKIDKYPDFKVFREKNPKLPIVTLCKIYRVSNPTVRNWLKQMKNEENNTNN